MKVFVFGNPDVKDDSLPLRIIPKLRGLFPDIEFEIKDPNEEWEFEKTISRDPSNEKLHQTEATHQIAILPQIIVIDTVVGIKEVTVFEDLNRFTSPPRLGMHDFDAITNLRYLVKLGKIGKVVIIGVPPEIGEEEAVGEVTRSLKIII